MKRMASRSMRNSILVAVCAVFAQPAYSARPIKSEFITQVTSDVWQNPINRFDQSLGVLQLVTVTMDIYKDAEIIIRSESTVPETVNWTMTGQYSGELNFSSGPPHPFWQGETSLFGKGSFELVNGYTSVQMSSSGRKTFIADKALFIETEEASGYIFGTGWWSQYFDPIPNITFDTNTPLEAFYFPAFGEDTVGRSDLIVTYQYAPGGVPEPAVWAMMILGFGAVGSANRSKQCKLRAA